MGYVNLFWFAPLFIFLIRVVGDYRCVNRAALRRDLRAIMRELNGTPVVICSNHLTMIDSMLITAFAFPLRKLFVNYRLFPWNVPEIMNFGGNLFLRGMCYLGKCIYVERRGSVVSKKLTWDKVKYMVAARDLVNIFPEGGRSRTGRVDPDAAVYGVGHLLQDIPECQVICVYLRGHSQATYSFFPKRHERFIMNARLIKPTSEFNGRRGARDLTQKVMNTLKEMEDAYFSDPVVKKEMKQSVEG